MLHPTIETLPLMPIPQHSWLIVNHPEKARIGTKISILTQLNANQVPTRVTIPHLVKGTSTIRGQTSLGKGRSSITLTIKLGATQMTPQLASQCKSYSNPRECQSLTYLPIQYQFDTNPPFRMTILHQQASLSAL